nr:uncharacterized protein LOC112017237 [Quercus suber]
MEKPPLMLVKNGSERSEGSSGSGGEEKGRFEYFGWVYHLGVNSIGREYCHLRFLFIRGKYVEMYKRDPHLTPGIKPIRRGVVGPTLMVEELGRQRVNHGDFYVIRFCNRLDEMKKGEGMYSPLNPQKSYASRYHLQLQMLEAPHIPCNSSKPTNQNYYMLP